ncbi:MAG: hypothetical protein G01um101416_1083 [Microgenomates group bacterium Gr01-1014_16]|nr:MAG: hypothetical protein G01um101416_1083 [Microgenomates group bacterium Gr01-1014_16]
MGVERKNKINAFFFSSVGYFTIDDCFFENIVGDV